MKKKILSVLKYTVFLGIGVFLMWWQLSKMTSLQRVQFVESLQNANYLYIIPIIIMSLLTFLSRAVRWKILIEPMGYHPTTANTFYSTLCGYFANSFLPRAGEILRCTLLSRYEKIPFSKLVGTIVLERLLDLICYFIVIVITFLIQIKTVSNFVKEKIEAISGQEQILPGWAKIVIPLLAAGLGYLLIKWVFKKYAHHPFISKLKKLEHGLKEGFSTIIHLKQRKAFLGHTFFIWAMYLMQVYIGFFALSETSHLGMAAAFSVLSLSTLAMIIAPGGIGAFPVAVQQVLLIYNVDNISFGWLIWSVNTGIIIVAGIISFGLLIYQNNKKHEKKQYHSGANNETGGNSGAGKTVEA
ncbi:MAG: lysylphosphatidylglycerol synthase transmembrane domain-containing protein [Ginsengibacter sp.]